MKTEPFPVFCLELVEAVSQKVSCILVVYLFTCVHTSTICVAVDWPALVVMVMGLSCGNHGTQEGVDGIFPWNTSWLPPSSRHVPPVIV